VRQSYSLRRIGVGGALAAQLKANERCAAFSPKPLVTLIRADFD
jgi:hypothetical protein